MLGRLPPCIIIIGIRNSGSSQYMSTANPTPKSQILAPAAASSMLVDSKKCSPGDVKLIEQTAGSILKTFSGYTKDEKVRLAQRTAENIKKSLNSHLGGNWNIILGKDLQISVGLTPNCRLFRMKSDLDSLFCFETYTKIIEPAEYNPAGRKPVESNPAEAKPAQAKPIESKPGESKPAEPKPVVSKPAETKPSEADPSDNKPSAI